jgi:hypothetical protein
VATVALLVHLTAVLVGAFAAPPASMLQEWAWERFRPYYELTDQGQSYRFYAPEPPPTPVVEATLHFADGRPERVLRLPDRSARPRMLYQRQLALANWLYAEYRGMKGLPANLPAEERPLARWALSYARHLGAVHGCHEVRLTVIQHLIPPPGLVAQRMRDTGRSGVDLDAEEFLSAPELIGVFPCDGS